MGPFATEATEQQVRQRPLCPESGSGLGATHEILAPDIISSLGRQTVPPLCALLLGIQQLTVDIFDE